MGVFDDLLKDTVPQGDKTPQALPATGVTSIPQKGRTPTTTDTLRADYGSTTDTLRTSGVFDNLLKSTQPAQPARPAIDAKIQAGETLSRADLKNMGIAGKTNAKQRETVTNVLRRQQLERPVTEAQAREAQQRPGGFPFPPEVTEPLRQVDPDDPGIQRPADPTRDFQDTVEAIRKNPTIDPKEKAGLIEEEIRKRQRVRAGEIIAGVQAEFEQEQLQQELGGKFLKKTGRRLQRGAANLASGALTFVAEVTKLATGGEFGETPAEWARLYHDALKSPEMRPLEENLFDKFFGAAAETLPFLIVGGSGAIATGGAAIPAFITSFTTAFMVEGGNAYQNALDRGLSERVARKRGFVVGLVNAGIEVVGGGGAKFFKKGPVITRTLSRLGRGKQFTKRLVKNALSEGLEEGLQETSSALLGGDIPRKENGDVDFDALATRIVDSFIAGAVLGTGFSGIQTGGAAIRQFATRRQQTKAEKSINAILDAQQQPTDVGQPPIPPISDIFKDRTPLGAPTLLQPTPQAPGAALPPTAVPPTAEAAPTIEAPQAPVAPIEPSKVTPLPQVAEPKAVQPAPVKPKAQAKEAKPIAKTADEAIGEQQGFAPAETQARLDKAEKRFRELKNKPVEDRTKREVKELAFLSRNRTDPLALMDRELRGFTREELNDRAKQFGIPFRGVKSSALIKKIKALALEGRERQEITGDITFKKGKPVEITPDKLLKFALEREVKGAEKGFRVGQLELTATHTELLDFAKKHLPPGEHLLVVRAAGKTVKARTPAQIRKVIEAVNKMTEKFEIASVKKDLIKTANKALAQIKKQKPMQKGGIRPEFGERLMKMIKSIALSDPTKKTLLDIKSLTDHLERVKADITNEFSEPYAEDLIPESRLAILEKIGKQRTKFSLKDASADDMRAITDEINRILHMNKTKNKTILVMRTADNNELLGNIQKEVLNTVSMAKKDQELRGINQREGVLRGITSALVGYKNDDVETLIETMGGGEQAELYEVVVEGLSEGRELEAAHGFDMIDPIIIDAHKEAGIDTKWLQRNVRAIAGRASIIRKILRKLGADIDVEPVETHKVKIGGKIAPLTLDEIMAIHMHAKADFNRRQMFRSPLVFPDGREIGVMTGEELAAIEKLMTKKGLIVTDKATQTIENVNKPGLNAVTRDMDGTDNFTEPDYWPMERFTEKGPRGKRENAFSLLESRNWTKERRGGNQPIILRGFYETYMKMAAGSAEFVGLAKPLRAIKMVLNDKKRFIDPVNKNGYENNRKALNTLIERLEQHPSDDSMISRLFAFPLRGVTKTTLADPGIIVGQKTSTVGYLIDLDTSYAKNIKLIPTAKEIAEAKDISKWIRKRIEQGLSSASLGEVSANNALTRVITQEVPLMEKPLQGIHYVDTSAVLDGFRSAKDWVGRNLPNLKKGSPGWKIAVRRKAHFLIRRSQPMFDTEGRSVLTSDPRAGLRQFVLFRSYVDQVVRMVHRTNTLLGNGKITKRRWTRQMGILWATLATHVITKAIVYQLVFGLPAALVAQLLFGTAKIKDPKELAFEVGRDTLLAPIKLVTFVGYGFFHIAKSAVNNIRKRVSADEDLRFSPPGKGKVSTIATSVIEDMLTSAGKFGEAASLAGSGETFKSGKNEGRSKAWVATIDASTGSVHNALRLSGAPIRPFLDWKKQWDIQVEHLKAEGVIGEVETKKRKGKTSKKGKGSK